ncbi:MAG TPA: hypothetical protein PLP33_24920 [Leptospiraceae bacterium]|nr:hypothetical protein [Leptospiraceae bacterium]
MTNSTQEEIEQKIAETFFRHFVYEVQNGRDKESFRQILEKNPVMKRCVEDKLKLEDIITMYMPKQ